MRPLALLASGSLVAALAAALWRSSATKQATVDAVEAGGTIKLRLTGYWPSTAKASEKAMEGGSKDRKGAPLHTVEDYLAGKSDHVSLSGDDAAWPYGQAVMIPWFDKNIKGRVTDTGSHFRGVKKLYRIWGDEPVDVDVFSSKTKVPSGTIVASILKGDTLDKPGKAVATDKFKGQTVAVGVAEIPVRLHAAIERGSILFTEMDDPAWRAAAEQVGREHGDRGDWGQNEYGGWHWREENGSFSSTPLSVAKLIHPGMAPLLDWAHGRNDASSLHMLGAA